jgi:hypothetical protein
MNIKKISSILAVIVALFTIVGGVYTFADRYATNDRVDKVEVNHDKDLGKIEVELAGALEAVQNKIDVKHLQFMYDTINRDVYELKRQIRRYPDDKEVEEDYKELLRRKQYVKDKLDKALENIRVN